MLFNNLNEFMKDRDLVELAESDFKNCVSNASSVRNETNSINRYIRSRTTPEAFRLDGCGRGKNVCVVSREICEILWNFNDRDGKQYFKEFGTTEAFDEPLLMEPDMYTSFFGPFSLYLDTSTYILQSAKLTYPGFYNNRDRVSSKFLASLVVRDNESVVSWVEKKEDWEELASLSDSLGSLGMVPKFMNREKEIAPSLGDRVDYSLQYLKENGFRIMLYNREEPSMKPCDFNRFVNSFFLWGYTTPVQDEYVVNPLENHSGNFAEAFSANDNDFPFDDYLRRLIRNTEMRGIFMAVMLRIALDYPKTYVDAWNVSDVYRKIFSSVLRTDGVYESYEEVIDRILGEGEYEKVLSDQETEALRPLLISAKQRITEIRVERLVRGVRIA